MGYIQHRAIVVTAWDNDYVQLAHNEATRIFNNAELGHLVSSVISSKINGYESFLIAPDGSKLGWEASNRGKAARDEFIAWLKKERQNRIWIDWVLIQYGDDEGITKLIDSNQSEEDNEY